MTTTVVMRLFDVRLILSIRVSRCTGGGKANIVALEARRAPDDPGAVAADKVAPAITCPSGVVSATATSAAGASLSVNAQSVLDDCDPNPVVQCTATAPLGSSSGTCTATDASDNP